MRAITLAIVYVLPEPVTPSSVWNERPSVEALDQLVDRLRLVAGGLERLVQLVRAVGECEVHGLWTEFACRRTIEHSSRSVPAAAALSRSGDSRLGHCDAGMRALRPRLNGYMRRRIQHRRLPATHGKMASSATRFDDERSARPSALAAIEMAPRDPILGVTEAFNADPNPHKVNLGVGVYCDDNGKVPLLECVHRAERALADKGAPARLPADRRHRRLRQRGAAAWCSAPTAEVVQAGRVVTVQALGGTGALKVGADFLRRFAPGAQVWISDPSWENHRALFEGAGFAVNTYPYYDAATHGLDFDGMLAALQKLPAGAIVVLHACCHNPTGVDPDDAQWGRIIEVVRARGAACRSSTSPTRASATASTPTARSCAASPPRPGRCSSSSSFSKSFSLYGERVGALSIVAADTRRSGARAVAGEARRAHQLLEPADARRPDRRDGARHAGAPRAVGAASSARCASAFAPMRQRAGRASSHVRRRRAPNSISCCEQRGMFSYSGLTKEQVARLRERIFDLRDRHRPHLRRGAQLAQHRLRRGRHRHGPGVTDCRRQMRQSLDMRR